MGIYVATMRLESLDGLLDGGRAALLHTPPGRAAAIHPSRGDALAFFAFRSPAVPGFDYRDTAQHKRLLAAAFTDASWRVPELLKRVDAADDLYFDSVSQVRVRPWWHGRVALVGDAASCVSLFGDGSSLAMAGAVTLAPAAAANPRRPPRGLGPLRGQPPDPGGPQAAQHRAGRLAAHPGDPARDPGPEP